MSIHAQATHRSKSTSHSFAAGVVDQPGFELHFEQVAADRPGDDRAINGQHSEVEVRAVGLGAEPVRRESGDRRARSGKRLAQDGPDQDEHVGGGFAAFGPLHYAEIGVEGRGSGST